MPYKDKQAERKYMKAYRLTHKEYFKEKLKAYALANKNKLAETLKRYAKNNREKIRARQNLYYAIKVGKIKKATCEICGKPAEAHHEDYSKALEVRWLCRKHHIQLHHPN